MAETTPNQAAQTAADLAAAARERGIDELEGAKGHLAEGAERIAEAVERTTDELGGEGSLSGFGHSVASLMRQLSGGLRERDVEEFARELGALARRNPGVFLAGSVAVGFGIARFFKARAPAAASSGYDRWDDGGAWQADGTWQQDRESAVGGRNEPDADESLDLSASATQRGEGSGRASTIGGSAAMAGGATIESGGARESRATTQTASRDDERGTGKSRPSSKPSKPKTQRAGSGSAQPDDKGLEASTERTPTEGGPTTNTGDGTSTSGGSRGGKQ
jgi:hypothetical protein